MQLSDYEMKILAKVIPTVSFSDYHTLDEAMRDVIIEFNEQAAPGEKKTDLGLKSFEKEHIANIMKYLTHEGYYSERAGGVFFITDKGKDLRHQGSIEKYHEWRGLHDVDVLEDLHTIATKGYLDREQEEVKQIHHDAVVYKEKKNLFYPVLGIIILLVLAAAAYHYVRK